MQRYICVHCDDLRCDSSVCPVCGSRTIPQRPQVYWCGTCKTPNYNDVCGCCGSSCQEMASDIRPVFPEERLLIEILLKKPMFCKDCSCFSSGGGVYFFDGKKVRIPISTAVQNDTSQIIKELALYSNENMAAL